MHRVTSDSTQVYIDGYCSQMRTPPPSPRTIEEGVMTIERILGKVVLCWHDVLDINRTYQAIDLLERRVDRIPERNSQHVLEAIIGRVEKIVRAENISATDLISLYHLQNFSIKELQIGQCFSNMFRKRDQVIIDELAIHLPCCHSEDQFEKDAASLLWLRIRHVSEKVTQLLNYKKEQLRNYTSTQQAIAGKKLDLKKRRAGDPQNYPPYFDELLDNGYIHLYDHLVQIRALPNRNERRSEIEKMTFSLLSHVVLETRAAVIQKVEKAIPAGSPNVLFLLGGSGAGKSTTLCFLRGDTMILEHFHYKSQNEKSSLIGHKEAASCTFLPTVEIVNDLVVADFPGLDDTSGPLLTLGMECALKALITKYHPKVLVLEAITNTEGKFAAAAGLGLRLSRLLDNKENCILGITKYSKDPDFGEIKTIEEQQKKEREAATPEEIGLIATIKTLSALNIPVLLPTIEQNQQQLAKIQQEKAERLRMPLSETAAKQHSKRVLQERENELLGQIGLGHIMRFCNLENPKYLFTCLDSLSRHSVGEQVRVNPQRSLDPADDDLLYDRFVNDLMKKIETQNTYHTKFEDFEKSVLSSSLINTLFCQSNPEIGQFLHLPEIDPAIVRRYDKEIVGSCLKKYIGAILKEFNMALIKKILESLETKVSKEKVIKLRTLVDQVQKLVLGLEGAMPDDPAQADKVWEHIQKQHQKAVHNAGRSHDMPKWVAVLELGFLLGGLGLLMVGEVVAIGAIAGAFAPPTEPGTAMAAGVTSLIAFYGLETFLIQDGENKASQKVMKETIDTCCSDLERVCETLRRLKEIERMVTGYA